MGVPWRDPSQRALRAEPIFVEIRPSRPHVATSEASDVHFCAKFTIALHRPYALPNTRRTKTMDVFLSTSEQVGFWLAALACVSEVMMQFAKYMGKAPR